MNRKRKLMITLVLLIACAAVLVSAYLNNIRKLTVLSPELTVLADGEYQGEYTILPVNVEVIVSIENKRISDIEILKHFNGLGKQAEAVIPLIIDNQTLDVEAVSGATVSSKCILKAIENAVVQGANQ